ncbi:ATP-binding protein [Firmicutes bacterium AF36-3BH]|jgi:hypothetical protein|nr:ATP-binding protein [Firmicutes bacterium AF36-3BH]
MAVEDVEMPVEIEELYSAFETADNILLKKYVSKLSKYECKTIDDNRKKIEVGGNVNFFQILNIVYDKKENIQDKLTTVYSTISSLKQCGLVMILNADKEKVNLYVGIKTKELNECDGKLKADEKKLGDKGKTLKNAFDGNFPGIRMENVFQEKPKGNNSYKTIKEVAENAINNKIKFIASVSSIPALRNAKEHKNIEFIQGIEKLIESMRGKSYSAIIIADAVGNDEIEEMCAEYENIYSQLSPFKASDQTISKQEGTNTSESIIKGTTETINTIVSNSTSKSDSVSNSRTDNWNIPVVSLIYTRSNGKSNSQSNTSSYSQSNGSSTSTSEQNSTSSGKSTSESNSVRITFENRSVKTLMDRVDEQIKRLRSCEDFGMFDTCAYFTSADYDVAVAAASVFKSVTRGENSSVESSAVNIWSEDDKVEAIKKYLLSLYHPEFEYEIGNKKYTVKPSLLMSGKELAFEMSLPKKSVPGIPVIECAEFGREVTSLDSKDGIYQSVELGEIYHMHDVDENTPVKFDVQSLASHTFITGSTGAGKSNAIYQLLSELGKKEIKTENKDNENQGGTQQKIKFMVIEPAKGEYKDVFGGVEDVDVYGTNPKKATLLKINPFSFVDDIHVLEHIDRLVEIFNACWPMYAAMPAVLKDAIERIYIDKGWDLNYSSCEPKVFPTLYDLLKVLPQVMEESQYSLDTKSDYSGALITRIKSLTNGINGQIFCTSEDADKENEKLFEKNVIVDISRIGSTETKSLIMGMLIMKLQEYRMSEGEVNSNLQHVTVLEEAHNLLRRTTSVQTQEGSNLQGKSVEMISNAIAEMRTYGEGFIIADQAPGLLDESVIRNTNTKIIFRLPDEQDRILVGRSEALNDNQISELAKLPRGVAAVYQNNWVQAVLCKFEKFETKSKYQYTPKGESEYLKKYFYKLFGIRDGEELSEENIDFIREWINALNLSEYTKSLLGQVLDGQKLNEGQRSEIAYNVFKGKQLGYILQNNSDEEAGIDDMKKSIYNMFNIQDELLTNVIKTLNLTTIMNELKHTELANRYAEFAEGGRIV